MRPTVQQKVIVPYAQENNSIGIFILANWALSSESQNIAIITGLIGFAIFGSVLEAFSRDGFSAGTNFSDGGLTLKMYYDLMVVLVRGFAALVVICLSIKGGMSLITNSTANQLNPYVILFLCFIAAVYSDDI